MSKLLAMMMKPKNYMYATIKGSLTENNGVFSDFSDTNYLALQKPFNANDYSSWEIVIKVNSGSSVGAKYFVGYLGYGFVLGTTMANSIRHFKAFFSSNGSSWDIGNIQCVDRVIANTDYYVKVGFNGTKYYIEQSTDGINYIGRNELLSSTKIISGDLLIGNGYNINNFWNGSIYNNQSYIKINNTKYQLQAVVGYTVVGSPTIVDGVVSGFSDSNYILIDNNSLQNATDWEMCFKYNTKKFDRFSFLISGNNSNNSRCFIISLSQVNNFFYFYVNYTNGQWETQINTGNTGITLQANTDYWVKVTYKNGVYSIYISTNGKNYIAGSSANGNAISDYIGLIIGKANWAETTTTQGSFDLNETYIKINNKLLFNGQPAE